MRVEHSEQGVHRADAVLTVEILRSEVFLMGTRLTRSLWGGDRTDIPTLL